MPRTVQRIENDVFVSIAHPVRRDILQRLASGALSVMQLAEPFDMSRSAVGQHLDILLQSGMVSRTKQGRKQMYRLERESLKAIQEWVAFFEQHWQESLDSLEEFLDDLAEEEQQE